MAQLLISAEQVLPGPVGERITNGAVLIDGNRITAVGSRRKIQALTCADVIEQVYPEGTVLPGLINCHVHLALDAGPDPMSAVQHVDTPDLLLGIAGRAQQLLDAGVTTARDMGDREALTVHVRNAIDQGILAGPRLMAATVPLTSPGGHCWFLGGEVNSDEAIRHQIRSNAENGADVIKVMASGGAATPGGPAMWKSQFTTSQLRLIVAEARKYGLPVAVHAHGVESISSAVQVGVDTIEHCTWLTEDFGFHPSADLAAQMVSKSIAVCPALSRNWRRIADLHGAEKARRIRSRVRWLHEQGVLVAAGTDAGQRNAPFDDMVGALEMYQDVGISNEDIIAIATVNGAAALGLSGAVGQLHEGFSADVLVVDGDPLTDLGALSRVELVLARGRPHIPTAGLWLAGRRGGDA